MFTGLIEDVGEVLALEPVEGGSRIRLASALGVEVGPGDSLAVNGVCLTIVASRDGEVTADVGPETARVSTLGRLRTGQRVNLERPLRADARIGGHFVQGHVDAVGSFHDRRAAAGFWWLTFGFPSSLAPYVVLKGSIAVDGVSLTIARLDSDALDVQIVPFTWSATNLSALTVGDPVNLECDVIGKYVVRATEIAAAGGAGHPASARR
jgi:riboflavin synthase